MGPDKTNDLPKNKEEITEFHKSKHQELNIKKKCEKKREEGERIGEWKS